MRFHPNQPRSQAGAFGASAPPPSDRPPSPPPGIFSPSFHFCPEQEISFLLEYSLRAWKLVQRWKDQAESTDWVLKE